MRTWVEKLGRAIEDKGMSYYSNIVYNGENYRLYETFNICSLNIRNNIDRTFDNVTIKIYEDEKDYLTGIFKKLKEEEKERRIKEFESL